MNSGPPSPAPVSELPAACHSLMERSPVPMAELETAAHVVRYVNPAFCRLTGKARQALTGRPFAEMVQQGDSCLAVLDRIYRTGEPETHTEPEHAGRHPVYWSYSIWPVLDENMRPAGVMMQVTETTQFHRDAGAMNQALILSSVRQHEKAEADEKLNDLLRREVTHRRRVEESLRASEESYRVLVGQVKDYAIFRIDLSGRVTSWNEGVKEILGFDRDEFIGRDIVTIFTPEDIRDGVAEWVLRMAVLEGSAGDDRWLRRKDGTRFFAQGVTVRLKNQSGSIVGFTKIFRDVTSQREAEEALERSHAELLATAEELGRFNSVAVGREKRMIELKKESNELCRRLGEPARYPLEFEEQEGEGDV